jgi:hypothetical protein
VVLCGLSLGALMAGKQNRLMHQLVEQTIKTRRSDLAHVVPEFLARVVRAQEFYKQHRPGHAYASSWEQLHAYVVTNEAWPAARAEIYGRESSAGPWEFGEGHFGEYAFDVGVGGINGTLYVLARPVSRPPSNTAIDPATLPSYFADATGTVFTIEPGLSFHVDDFGELIVDHTVRSR